MPSSIRNHFLLDPNIVFLNHGSFGACPQPVFDEYQRWQRELENRPVEFLGRRFTDLLALSSSTSAKAARSTSSSSLKKGTSAKSFSSAGLAISFEVDWNNRGTNGNREKTKPRMG